LLLSALLTAQPSNHAEALRQDRGPAPFHVVRAEQEMRRSLADRITVAGLAAAAGVSERTLHDGFRRFRGVTPMAAVLRLRLAAARRLLRRAAPGTTVTAVAARVGLSQPGRFARAYRQVFGELPSATLRRAPRR